MHTLGKRTRSRKSKSGWNEHERHFLVKESIDWHVWIICGTWHVGQACGMESRTRKRSRMQWKTEIVYSTSHRTRVDRRDWTPTTRIERPSGDCPAGIQISPKVTASPPPATYIRYILSSHLKTTPVLKMLLGADRVPGLPNVWYDPCRDLLFVLSIPLFNPFILLNDILLDLPRLGGQ